MSAMNGEAPVSNAWSSSLVMGQLSRTSMCAAGRYCLRCRSPEAIVEIENFLALGLDQIFDEAREDPEINGRKISDLRAALNTTGDRAYHPCSHAYRRSDVDVGTVTRFDDWSATSVYAGTSRDVAVYVPAGLDREQPAPLMVFNDGLWYLDEKGQVRAAAVLDSLINRGEIEPVVAVFVMPGRPGHTPGSDEDEAALHREMMMQRCFEYDSLNDSYVSFLDEELLPDLSAQLGLTMTSDPARRAICGMSSGGICAFTAAWFRPASFGLVMSHCGSFVNVRGGHNYPFLIRSAPRKSVRVLLTSGELDGDIITGNWPLANKQMAAALEFAGYETRFEFGTGGHNLRHAGAIFADSLRWLWSS